MIGAPGSCLSTDVLDVVNAWASQDAETHMLMHTHMDTHTHTHIHRVALRQTGLLAQIIWEALV